MFQNLGLLTKLGKLKKRVSGEVNQVEDIKSWEIGSWDFESCKSLKLGNLKYKLCDVLTLSIKSECYLTRKSESNITNQQFSSYNSELCSNQNDHGATDQQ